MSEDVVFHSFSNLLAAHAEGSINHQLTEGLQEVVAALSNKAIERGGKHKAKITLTVDVTLDQGVFTIAMDPAVKLPKVGGAQAVYWATDKNRLTPSNPKQMKMFSGPTRTNAIEDNSETRTA